MGSLSAERKDAFVRFWSSLHEATYRVTEGRALNQVLGMTVIRLVSTGRRSGQERSTMLTAPIVDGGGIVLVASNARRGRVADAGPSGAGGRTVGPVAPYPCRHTGLPGLPAADGTGAAGGRTRAVASGRAGPGRASSGHRSSRRMRRPAPYAWVSVGAGGSGGTRSASRARTRRSISSTMGRTCSTGSPAGSSSSQSRYRRPG